MLADCSNSLTLPCPQQSKSATFCRELAVNEQQAGAGRQGAEQVAHERVVIVVRCATATIVAAPLAAGKVMPDTFIGQPSNPFIYLAAYCDDGAEGPQGYFWRSGIKCSSGFIPGIAEPRSAGRITILSSGFLPGTITIQEYGTVL